MNLGGLCSRCGWTGHSADACTSGNVWRWFVLDGRGDKASGPWKSRGLACAAWRILDPFGKLAYVARLPIPTR